MTVPKFKVGDEFIHSSGNIVTDWRGIITAVGKTHYLYETSSSCRQASTAGVECFKEMSGIDSQYVLWTPPPEPVIATRYLHVWDTMNIGAGSAEVSFIQNPSCLGVIKVVLTNRGKDSPLEAVATWVPKTP